MKNEETQTDPKSSLTVTANSENPSSSKSIIENWKNPPKPSPEPRYYEERAIDVVIDHCPVANIKPKIRKKQKEQQKLSTFQRNLRNVMEPTQTSKSRRSNRKSQRTRRSTPSNDRRSSVTQHFESVQKSLSNRQKETLVTEPQNIEIRSSNNGKWSEFSKRLRPRRDHFKEIEASTDSLEGRYNVVDDSSQRLSSNSGFYSKIGRRSTRSTRKVETSSDCDMDRPPRFSKIMQDQTRSRGSVNQKINAYEKNMRLGKEIDTKRQLSVLGVPLVGMHNACGLPVVASWPETDDFEALKISGTLKPVFKHRSLRCRRKTLPKRRAPQPEPKLLVPRRTSFKATRTATVPARAIREHFLENIQETGSLMRNSSLRRSEKRRTLYAKDDGEDAVEVLTNLCLNPMARSCKRGSFMMW